MRVKALFLAATFAASVFTAAAAVVKTPCIVNIINFVRKTEPRIDAITDEILYKTTENEAVCMLANGLRGTFLLQYDALIDPKYQELMRSLPSDFEVGGWWEITQPHVEAAGLKWRGRYPWDWHANVGFATGYTPEEREKLVDVYMKKFKDVFGKYPESVGSWFIDAHSLKYMYDKYHIVASCNCRDQVGTDGYTMWGGYWQGGYYPSVNNAYIPAQTKKEQINVPVFRMLGSDPLYQYDFGIGGAVQGVSTLEPVYDAGGGSESWVNWFMTVETEDPAMGFTYFQAGQENSFTWDRIRPGFEMQMRKIAELKSMDKLQIYTLGQTGKWFSQHNKLTPPTAMSAMSDYTSRNAKTLWYNSRYYRTNLFWEGGRFRFRDIQLYNEDNRSLYLTTPGTSNECHYYALPLVDGCLWSSAANVAGLRILAHDAATGGYSEIKSLGQTIQTKNLTTIVHLNAEGGRQYTITLREKSFVVESNDNSDFSLELTAAPEAKLPFTSITSNLISAARDGFAYSAKVKHGKAADTRATQETGGFRISSQNGWIELFLAQK